MMRRHRSTARATHRLVFADPLALAAARRRRGRRRIARTVAVMVVGSALLATLPAGADAVTRPTTLLDLRPVSAGVVDPSFPVDHVGVRFRLGVGLDVHDVHDRVQVRFRHGNRWGGWATVAEDGAQQEGWWTGALVAADDADAYQVRGVPGTARDVRAAAINTTDGPLVVVGHRRAGAAEASTPCRSRADWGADEGLRKGSPGFAPLQVTTVHHTAGDNAAAVQDPDAVVRAIYSWHTTGNGWDDIGYQAMIAPDGTLYEGRWSGSASRSCLTGSGDGTDFGHASTDDDAHVVVGAHAGGHNTGNYGVALLGTHTEVAPAAAARAALVDHLAEVTGRHGLDPTGTVDYDNGVNAGALPAIAGHRDINATECPGGVLYADLPQLRTDVAAAQAAPPAEEPPAGEPPVEPVEPVVTEVVVHGEQAVTGTVQGTWAGTTSRDDVSQRLTEVESGGKPSTRHALLEHVWLAELPTGHDWSLTVDAAATAAGDGDDFAFAVSTDGTTWTPVTTVRAGSSQPTTGLLPAGTVGTVRIRVVDTVRSRGAAALDTIAVDRLVLTPTGTTSGTDVGTTEPEAEPTSDILLTATGSKQQGHHVADLAWTGATDVTVERDGRTVATLTGSTWVDRLGTKGSASHTYRVCTATACSAYVTVTW